MNYNTQKTKILVDQPVNEKLLQHYLLAKLIFSFLFSLAGLHLLYCGSLSSWLRAFTLGYFTFKKLLTNSKRNLKILGSKFREKTFLKIVMKHKLKIKGHITQSTSRILCSLLKCFFSKVRPFLGIVYYYLLQCPV